MQQELTDGCRPAVTRRIQAGRRVFFFAPGCAGARTRAARVNSRLSLASDMAKSPMSRAFLLAAVAPLCASIRLDYRNSVVGYTLPPRASFTSMSASKDDASGDAADLDAILKRELEAAFQGINRKMELDASEEAQFDIIEQETKRVLDAVLDELDAGGANLRANLEAKATKMASEESKRLMARADKTSAAVAGAITANRATVLEEMATLKDLKQKYDQLKEEKAAQRKSGLFGVAAFIAGLAYVSTGVNDLLRVATGASDQDAAVQGVAELALGAVGIYVYQSRIDARDGNVEK
eukprot:scaffold6194_cov131-Isochrysis_galbana.AAC.2